jgi:hypothetical protein
VAISLGDGRTIEARGHEYPVGSYAATTGRFNYAAYIPGLAAPGGPVPTGFDPVVVAFSDTDPTTGYPTDEDGWHFGVDPDSLDLGPDQAGADVPVLVGFDATTGPAVPPPPGPAFAVTNPGVNPVDPTGTDPVLAAVPLGTLDLDGDGLDDSLEPVVGWSSPPPAGGPTDHSGWDHDSHDHVAH